MMYVTVSMKTKDADTKDTILNVLLGDEDHGHGHGNESEYQEINHYQMSHHFEKAVEYVNSAAGFLVLLAVLLAGINLVIVAINALTGFRLRMINPLHHMKSEVATVSRIRLMLGEQTALALSVLVAADVLDTVIKPSHAYEMTDVIKMGFVTVLRTGVAYFLAREIKELEETHMEQTLTDGESLERLIAERVAQHEQWSREQDSWNGEDISSSGSVGEHRDSSGGHYDNGHYDRNDRIRRHNSNGSIHNKGGLHYQSDDGNAMRYRSRRHSISNPNISTFSREQPPDSPKGLKKMSASHRFKKNL